MKISKVKNQFNLIFVALCSLLLTACGASSGDLYDIANSEALSENILGTGHGNLISPEAYLNWVNQVKWWGPYIITLSFVLGIILAIIFKHAKVTQRKFILIFNIGIPLFTLFLIYFMAWMYGNLF